MEFSVALINDEFVLKVHRFNIKIIEWNIFYSIICTVFYRL